MSKWLIRIALAGVALAVVIIAGGAAWEQIARRNASVAYPPPGKLVDIGGRRMQIDCRGHGAPVVVFESGLDALGALSWAAVHDSVARFTRACAYSRAGIMWSAPAGRPFSAANVADDLHAALAAAGEKPPYVLVSHSLGGPYSLVFTERYGRDVVGLVFVDASHPDQAARLSAAVGKTLDPGDSQARIGAMLAWTGLTRLVVAINLSEPPHAPRSIDAPNSAFLPQSLPAVLAELNGLNDTLAAASHGRTLGDRPLFVLTHGAKWPPAVLKAQGLSAAQGARIDAAWLALQNDEASWSRRSKHEVVAGASHYIQFDRPNIVIAAVRDVVETVRKDRGT